MSFKSKLNPFTGQMQLVFDGSLVKIKEAVATYNDLPITGNSESDLRVTQDTDRMYVWTIASSGGSLSDWSDVGSTTSMSWGNLTGTLSNQIDLQNELNAKANITALDTKLDKTNASITDSIYSTTSQIITFPANDSFNFNDKEFTIEMFVKFSSFSGDMLLYDHGATTYPLQFRFSTSNNRLEVEHRGNVWYTPTNIFFTDIWYHIAFSRESTWARLFVDGVEKQGQLDASSILQANDSITLFSNFNGYISNLRVSSIQRYINTFTLPTKDFEVDSSTLLLIKGSAPIIDETGKELTTVTVTNDSSTAPFIQDAIVTVDENGNSSSSDISLSIVKDLKNNKHVPNTDEKLAEGESNEVSATDLRTHIDSTLNPHNVTTSDLGLENVNNTSDVNKPISSATQSALDEKIGTLDPSPNTDLSANGIKTSFVAGENLSFGDVCYLKSDGKYWKANATISTTSNATAMALETITADSSGIFIILGYVRNDTWSFTVGGVIYLNTTSGSITQTQPSSTGNIIQILGVAISSTSIMINPNLVQIEVA